MRLDAIGKKDLVEWWAQDIEGRELSTKTGRNYLDALSGVLNYALDLELIEAEPATAFRQVLRKRGRSKKARAARAPSQRRNPIEKPDQVAAFVAASAELGGEGHLADLLQLDAGLRLGEVGGVSWSDIWWGRDSGDVTRSIRIHETRPRGRGGYDVTKGGLERTVAMSRRLRSALRKSWMELGQPEESRIIHASDQSNYRKRHFARACKLAVIGHRRPKDLRDTFASQLLTAGVSLGYISQQLGHADAAVTARYYARYIDDDGYRPPVPIREGEVPADLLARLDSAAAPQPPQTASQQVIAKNEKRPIP